jgi:hypothetical protein
MKTYLVHTTNLKFVAVNAKNKKQAYQLAKSANYPVKKVVTISDCHSSHLYAMTTVIAIIN